MRVVQERTPGGRLFQTVGAVVQKALDSSHVNVIAPYRVSDHCGRLTAD